MSAPPEPALSTSAPGDAPPLAGDGFSPYVVQSRWGPHVTVQAGVLGSGRFWTTTNRSSLKARSVRTHGVAAALIEGDDGTVEVLGGSTVALDATRPLGATGDPCALLGITPAVARLLGEQAQQLLGYVEARTAVPRNWLPHNRVVLATRAERQLVLDGYDVVEGQGSWEPRLADPSNRLRPASAEPTSLPTIPGPAEHLVRPDRPARLGLSTPDGPIVLPAHWQGDDRFDVSATALACTTAQLPGPGAVTFDDSASRRPDEKVGVLLRGDATLVDLDHHRATVALHARRVTTWDGFAADTVDPDAEVSGA